MTDFVVGDIQGCYSGLRRLLDKAEFDSANDKLWAVGDLVARGPESLETLKYLYGLGGSFDTVLGNHDLHFLAIYSGFKDAKRSDYLAPLLNHKHVERYVHWLRNKPLALKPRKNVLITHAGLYPNWSVKKALDLSAEIHNQLTGDNWQMLLKDMYGNDPVKWCKELKGMPRWRFIINAFTRMRFLTDQRELEFSTKTAPDASPENIFPWFNLPNSKLKDQHLIIFGHWAALMGHTSSKQFVGLDTGYVWGNQLTMLNLDKNKTLSISNIKN